MNNFRLISHQLATFCMRLIFRQCVSLRHLPYFTEKSPSTLRFTEAFLMLWQRQRMDALRLFRFVKRVLKTSDWIVAVVILIHPLNLLYWILPRLKSTFLLWRWAHHFLLWSAIVVGYIAFLFQPTKRIYSLEMDYDCCLIPTFLY